MCRRNLFHFDLRVCTELQVLSKTASRLWFYAYKKYKNGNSARRTASQRHIRPSICYGGSDNFSSGISGKLPKIELQNAIFSGTADCIAAQFCMDVAHDVDASIGNVKMTLKSVRYLTTSFAVLRDCRGFAIRKVACSNSEFYLRYTV